MLKITRPVGISICVCLLAWVTQRAAPHAAEPTHSAVFPDAAAAVEPIQLSDLIATALPAKGSTRIEWDHMTDAPIVWVTVGVETRESGDYTRTGLARVRIGDRFSSTLRQKRVELAWTVTLTSANSIKWGVEGILIEPGVAEEMCFGSLFELCDFEAADFSNAPLAVRLVCEAGEGMNFHKKYRVQAPGKRDGLLVLMTSGGSGGASSSILISPWPDEKVTCTSE